MRQIGRTIHLSLRATAFAAVLAVVALLQPAAAGAAATLTYQYNPTTKSVTLEWTLPSGESSFEFALFTTSSPCSRRGDLSPSQTSLVEVLSEPGATYYASIRTVTTTFQYLCSNVVTITVPPDTDGDRVLDPVDQCPTQSASSSNGCPTFVGNSDSDGDGVSNWADNCVDQPNAGQTDADGDGLGAACDANDGGGVQLILGSATIDGVAVGSAYTVVALKDTATTSNGSLLLISPVPREWSWAAGSAIRLGPNTAFTFERLSALLRKGSAHVDVKKSSKAFRVKAGNATVKVPAKGAKFTVEKQGKRTVVRGQAGAVKVVNSKGSKKKTVTLKKGMQTVVPNAGPPTKPVKYKLKPCKPTAQLKPFHWQCPGKLPGSAT